MPRHAAHFRLKLRGPVYQVRFTRNKQEHRLSTETGDYQRAKQEAARLVLEHDAAKTCKLCGGGGAAVGPQPIDRLSEAFLKAVLRTHGAAYQKRATTDMVQYIEKRWTDPHEITSTAWEEWKVDLHEKETERRERLSWGSIANLANTLRAFLRYCASVGAVEGVPELRNPSAKELAAARAYLRPLDRDEQQAFLWALAIEGEGRALRVYIALFETWMRKGELAAMTPRWISFERQEIRIPAQHSKNGYPREIDLTPRAAEAIRAEMGDPVELDAPIFGPFVYRSLFARICEIAGIDPKGLTAHHVTRRTAATLAGEKPGASLAGLKAQGGWRSSAVVDRYMRPSVEAARKVTR